MNFLVLQETDWLRRGPHPQHHIFERLSTNKSVKIVVFDYDIDHIQKSESLFVKTKIFSNITKTIPDSKIEIIRTSHLKIPYLRRITSLISTFFNLIKFIKKSRPSLIVSYSMTNGTLGFIVSRLYNIPYIFHYIDILHELVPIPTLQAIAKIVSVFLLKHSDLVYGLTKLHKFYLIHQGVPRGKVRVLPNGISIENLKIDTQKVSHLRNKYGLSPDDFVLFFMGYLYDFAGLEKIIRSYHPKVSNAELRMKFLILGDGGVYPELKSLVEELAAEWVIMPGRVPFLEITEYISLADLCLMSFQINDITKEIMPIKVLEYMGMQKPVLSTKLPGVFYEIGENRGILFCNDQKELIEKIGDFSDRKEFLRQEGFEASKFVRKKYAWTEILKKFTQDVIIIMKSKT